MGRLRILHIITGLATGGAERALCNLLAGGLAAKFENHVLSLSDMGTMGPKIRELNVPITTLNMKGGKPSVSGIFKLRKLVREFKPQIIQGWMYHGNIAATLARWLNTCQSASLWNIRQTLYDLAHEKRMTQWVIRLNRYFSASPDLLLYNSQLAKSQHEKFGFSQARSMVIPNGIDIEQFKPSVEHRTDIRSQLGVPKQSIVVGHIARFHPMKNHLGFIKTAVRIADKHDNVRFLMSGTNVNFENKVLSSLIPEHLNDRFYLLGERQDIPRLMNALDIFCMSSSWGEGFPNVIGEAMAAGVPCVTTDVGDSAAVVGDCGLVAAADDQMQLQKSIDTLLNMPSEERRTLGEKSRQRIARNYSLDSVTNQYTNMYTSLSE